MKTISAYTITVNAKTQDLPFKEAIRGCSQFADEVVAMDFGSTDGTYEDLEALKLELPNLKIYRDEWDYTKPDMMGIAKTKARRKCTKEWCYQFDNDEIPHEKDNDKWRKLIDEFPQVTIFSPAIITFYGGVNTGNFRPSCYKWTLLPNHPWIIHGWYHVFLKSCQR